MNNDFGLKLKELREKKFPGQGLRKVGETLASRGGFGEYFFTQLNKMESGFLIPSPNFLLRLVRAYDANEQEKKEIFTAYSSSVALRKMAQVDKITNTLTHREAVTQLYRRVKKKKLL